MAPGPTREGVLLSNLREHLRLRRKGNAVQLVWEDKSEVTPGKVFSTLISEVNVTDIQNQRRGSLYNAKK